MTSQFPFFKFYICDGAAEVNKQEFAEATFKGGFYMFTQVPDQGIVKYAHGVDSHMITKHIQNLYSSFSASDVLDFTTEDDFFDLLDQEDTPVVVKFYEQWCTHCKALKKPYHVAATQLKSRARFLEVECSRNADTQAFCAKHEARAFPVLMAFDSERKAKFDYESRSVIFMEDFVDKFRDGAIGEPISNVGSGSTSITAEVSSTGAVNVKPSTLAETPAKPALGNEAALVARVAQLERMVEALAARIEPLERR